MASLGLKKGIFEGLLILGGIIGCLAWYGKRERQEIKGEEYGRRLSIGDELQWMPYSEWIYLPQGSTESGITGCFVPEGSIRSGMESVKKSAQGAAAVRRAAEKIEICHEELTEEEFFARIGSLAEELEAKNQDERIDCRINGSAGIGQFVRLDAGKEHWLYIRQRDSVYILAGRMGEEKWQKFLKGWVEDSGLTWDGLQVMKPEGSVLDEYTGFRGEGIKNMLQYGKSCVSIYGRVVLFHSREGGFYLKTESEYEEERLVEEVVLCPAQMYPVSEDKEEILAYFRERYPDLYRLKAYPFGENALWNSDREIQDGVFYKVEEPGESHGLFVWNGEAYEVVSRGKAGYSDMVDHFRGGTGYDYRPFLSWKQEEDGSIAWEDYLNGNYVYTKDLGGGEKIRLRAEIAERVPGELLDKVIYRAEIYDETEGRRLQELQVISSYVHESPFEFEDFNADGYLDLTAVYFYGANGGTASHYIFLPSKREFAELDAGTESELEYYGMYGVDEEQRRLHIHVHGTAVSGIETTYQWKNEMDYEKIKQFRHDETDGGMLVKIVRYEQGQEEVLSDYVYSMKEYMERQDIYGTYYEDFIWEKEVTDKDTGKKYMLRYAEVFLEEEAELNNGIYYDGRIYVYDEDTYLVSVSHSESIDPSESITWDDSVVWDDGNGEEEHQALVIRYPDGGYGAFPLSSLIRPDYQPAS